MLHTEGLHEAANELANQSLHAHNKAVRLRREADGLDKETKRLRELSSFVRQTAVHFEVKQQLLDDQSKD